MSQIDHLAERDTLNQVMVLVRDLDERRRVEVTHNQVPGHHVAKALGRFAIRGRMVGQLYALVILGELSTVTQVEVVSRHNSRSFTSCRRH